MARASSIPAGDDASRDAVGDHAGVPRLPPARWWSVRPAGNRKPATYTCPLCGHRLPAMLPHMLIAPEGDSSHRRHAHTECVRAARRTGRLASLDEWRATQPRPPSLLARIAARLRGGPAPPPR
jgi:hypothetical protein